MQLLVLLSPFTGWASASVQGPSAARQQPRCRPHRRARHSLFRSRKCLLEMPKDSPHGRRILRPPIKGG
jgi:hypothetical protein|eukprot:COSAG06_NODE_50_length_28525_cov_88.227010_10_plen_69_part_00